MRAAKIVAGCTYGPEALKIIGKAFDGAWARHRRALAGDADRAAAARERLAHAVLIVATDVCHESESIKGMAPQIVALSYRGSWLDPGAKNSRRRSQPHSRACTLSGVGTVKGPLARRGRCVTRSVWTPVRRWPREALWGGLVVQCPDRRLSSILDLNFAKYGFHVNLHGGLGDV
jgi:hypothetical protein